MAVLVDEVHRPERASCGIPYTLPFDESISTKKEQPSQRHGGEARAVPFVGSG
jgi:hypothetical protein